MQESPAENDDAAVATSPEEPSPVNENTSTVTSPATTKEEEIAANECNSPDLIEENDTGSNQQQTEQRPSSDEEQPSSFSPDLQEIDEDDAEHDDDDAQHHPNGKEAWSMLRKGAVAAVGGTMVGVGLVMVRFCVPSVGCLATTPHSLFSLPDSSSHTLWCGDC